jgi:hypothetical protein
MDRIRVEVPITYHLREFAPNIEKYKAVQISPHVGKIEIRRFAKKMVILFTKLRAL